MTTLLSLTLQVRPLETTVLNGWSGNLVRSWFLNDVGLEDPTLMAKLDAGDGFKPYSISPLYLNHKPIYHAARLEPEDTVTLRISSLDSDLSEFLSSRFAAHTDLPLLHLGETAFTVESAEVASTTDQAILEAQSLDTPSVSKYLQFEFVSPVAFRSKGKDIPFPLPEWVFGNLADRWNACCEIRLHPDLRQYASDCMVTERFRMRSVSLEFGNTHFPPVTGGLGTVTYRIWRGDAYWRRMMHVLHVFSSFAGVGVRTSIGMGQVWLARKQRGSEPEHD